MCFFSLTLDSYVLSVILQLFGILSVLNPAIYRGEPPAPPHFLRTVSTVSRKTIVDTLQKPLKRFATIGTERFLPRSEEAGLKRRNPRFLWGSSHNPFGQDRAADLFETPSTVESGAYPYL